MYPLSPLLRRVAKRHNFVTKNICTAGFKTVAIVDVSAQDAMERIFPTETTEPHEF